MVDLQSIEASGLTHLRPVRDEPKVVVQETGESRGGRGMDSYELEKQIEPHLREGDLDHCTKQVRDALLRLPNSPFHIATELDFTNDPAIVAQHFDTFLTRERARFDIRAVYTETNGFSINPDCWYFDLFAYDVYAGLEDVYWLAEWNSSDTQGMVLTGMEPLQSVYDSNSFRNKEYSETIDLASLFVVVRFQALISRSAPLMEQLKCPLLATSHDYDLIFEYRPDPQT